MLYIQLSYKDAVTGTWKIKQIPTGLTAKGNKKKAKTMIPQMIEKYSYLEKSIQLVDRSLDRDILFCDYLDYWLEQKRSSIRQITFEAYTAKIAAIKKYFQNSNFKLVDMTTITNLKNSDFEEEALFLSKTEIDDLLAFLHEKHPKILPIAFVGIYYGLRRSEILGLKWNAINFENHTITIDNTIVKMNTKTETSTTKTKNSRRELSLFPNAQLCFEAIRKTQEEYKEFFGSTYHDSDYVFTQEDGTPIDPNLLTKYFKKAFAEYGRPELSLHKLRHSCASMAIDNGWTVKQVQHWLGHADVQTTLNIYAHYDKYKSNSESKDLDIMSSNTTKFFTK